MQPGVHLVEFVKKFINFSREFSVAVPAVDQGSDQETYYDIYNHVTS
jgi:hypothetical protein